MVFGKKRVGVEGLPALKEGWFAWWRGLKNLRMTERIILSIQS